MKNVNLYAIKLKYFLASKNEPQFWYVCVLLLYLLFSVMNVIRMALFSPLLLQNHPVQVGLQFWDFPSLLLELPGMSLSHETQCILFLPRPSFQLCVSVYIKFQNIRASHAGLPRVIWAMHINLPKKGSWPQLFFDWSLGYINVHVICFTVSLCVITGFDREYFITGYRKL